MSYSRKKILENLDLNILTQFRYPNKIILKFKKGFKEITDKILKPKNLSSNDFEKTTISYIKEVEKTVIHDNNKSLLCIKYLRELKTIIDKRKKISFQSSDLNYDFPYNNQYFDILKLNQSQYYGSNDIYKSNPIFSEKHINIFREFFNNISLQKDLIIQILESINKIIEECFPLMVKFFLEDMTHSQYLTERIDYQDKVEAVISSVQPTGSIDSTRDIRWALKELLEKYLGISRTNIEYDVGGRQYSDNIKTQSFLSSNYVYFSHININKNEPDFKYNTLSNLLISVNSVLNQHNISFSENKTKFIINQQIQKKELNSLLKEVVSHFFSNNNNTTEYKRTIYSFAKAFRGISKSSIKITEKDFFKIIKEKGNFLIIVKSFDDFIQYFSEKISFDLKHNNKIIDTINLIVPFYTSKSISLKIFDLINYFIELAKDVKRFFQQSMDLRAVIKKAKFSERWDGSKGWLDIEASVKRSLSKGFITPYQTYRKRTQEDPPTIYLIFDTSGSMARETRIAQFFALVILSFFDEDINKFIVGWICESSLNSWYGSNKAYFKTQVKLTEDMTSGKLIPTQKSKKKSQYSRDKASYNYYYKDLKYGISIYNLDELMTDYHSNEFLSGLRDFLDNEEAGKTNTAIDVFNFLPAHYDLDNRGLKYVFVITDADFYSDAEKNDFVHVSQQLVDRQDVRFFFLWDVRRFWADSTDNLSGLNISQQFPTRQFIRRIIDKQVFDSQGNIKARINEADVKLLSFVYQHYEKVHLVRPQNMMKIGELKYVLHKLEQQKFFIP